MKTYTVELIGRDDVNRIKVSLTDEQFKLLSEIVEKFLSNYNSEQQPIMGITE